MPCSRGPNLMMTSLFPTVCFELTLLGSTALLLGFDLVEHDRAVVSRCSPK